MVLDVGLTLWNGLYRSITLETAPIASRGSKPNATYRHLPLERANAEGLKPFGTVLGRPDEAGSTPSNFYSQIRMSYPVDFKCDHPVDLSLATLRRREGEVRYLERHFQHTQTFIPLGAKPFVMVMTPPSGGDMPELSAARAFYFDGRQGLTLHLGVWHEFPFAVEDDTDIMVVLSSQTGYDLTTKDPLTQEALGPDLDKKDIAARTGVILCVDLDGPAGASHGADTLTA
jgi:ureidoglycolate lyase